MSDLPTRPDPAASSQPEGESEPPVVPARGSRLQGKSVLVTGGGTGIGRAIAMLFASEGASLVVAGRRSEPLQETVREIRRAGGVATFARGDVTKTDRAEMIVQSAIYNFGGLDVLVNNAGLFTGGSVTEINEKRWSRVLETNLSGPYLVSRLAIPAIRSRGGGSIVNIAAVAGLAGQRGAAAFAASKGGLIALTRSMALDLAPDRIRVNAICPGTVESGMTRGQDGGSLPDEASSRIPLGRAGRPEDVAHLALYLASDEAGWVTGSIFTVDGGRSEG
jgi:NAD(P)-dependent dehydrogenase (short-subunit alcohol dehydrogenase family)